jgi:4-hydroxy-tetrahydrodipicolinate synthase
MVYNNVEVTQVDMGIDLLKRICEIPNIGAIKECTPRLSKLDHVIQVLGKKVSIISGSESCEPYASLMGAHGFISGISNFNPASSLQLLSNIRRGDLKAAKATHVKQLPLYEFVWECIGQQSGGQIVAFKEATSMVVLGDTARERPPFLPLTEEQRRRLKDILSKMEGCKL